MSDWLTIFQKMAVKLGDVVPNFSAASTHGKIDFHTWCEVRKTRGQRTGHRTLLYESLINLSSDKRTIYLLLHLRKDIHTDIKCYDIRFWKVSRGTLQITHAESKTFKYNPEPLKLESCPYCVFLVHPFYAVIYATYKCVLCTPRAAGPSCSLTRLTTRLSAPRSWGGPRALPGSSPRGELRWW